MSLNSVDLLKKALDKEISASQYMKNMYKKAQDLNDHHVSY